MICPCCKESAIVLELSGIEIDYCPSCGGIWLDAGELELLLGKKSDSILSCFRKDDTYKEKKIRCPACHKKMEKVLYGNTRLDRCPKRHGIWFDKGELLEIFRAADIHGEILEFLRNVFSNEI